MKKIAIIAFYHSEASLCLAKYLAKKNICVDFYYITDLIYDKGYVSGFEYFKAKKRLGIQKLEADVIPEIYNDSIELNVQYFLLRILSYSPKLLLLNKLIFKLTLKQIKQQHYDAINVIGQHPWVAIIHDALKQENLIHTFHEVGSHQTGEKTTPLLDKVISDASKVILPSKATYNCFKQIPNSSKAIMTMIPIGKLETLLLYEKDIILPVSVNLSKPTFLFYGYIKPYKGLDLLVEAYKHLAGKCENFNLIIAGGGYDENIRFFKAKRNCAVINRFLTNEEMMKLNRLSTAILLPYRSASQSGIVLTSFMYGKPIVATKVGALVETVCDEINGLLVEPGDAEGFALAMLRLVEDTALLKKLQRGAFHFGIDDQFDWNKIAEKTIEFYFK